MLHIRGGLPTQVIPTHTITSNGGSFYLPGYPNVCVTIPKKAVAPKLKIPLELKVGLLARGSGYEDDYMHVTRFQCIRICST